jgi:hypothetical protein
MEAYNRYVLIFVVRWALHKSYEDHAILRVRFDMRFHLQMVDEAWNMYLFTHTIPYRIREYIDI